jgi:hypothetical protein
MATQKPTTARKKTTKRGPTKATALKTLGLTQEDLDALKELKTLRELHSKTAAQQEAKQATHDTLEAAGEHVPADLKTEVEAEGETPARGPFFVRNLRNIDVGIRLERQDKGARIDLKPRGQINDLKKLKDDDLDDEKLIRNVELGVVEIITAAEAKEIISKQSKNSSRAVHPALALLRNPKGEAYEQTSVPVVEDNSYTVAHLKPQGGEAGEIPSTGRGVDWEAARNGPVSPGGNSAIISDGFAPPDVAADAQARRKDIEGPAAGLGGINTVVVEAPQKG